MHEPNPLMRWVMFHFAGGDALVAGLVVMFLISFIAESPKTAWRWTASICLRADRNSSLSS